MTEQPRPTGARMENIRAANAKYLTLTSDQVGSMSDQEHWEIALGIHAQALHNVLTKPAAELAAQPRERSSA